MGWRNRALACITEAKVACDIARNLIDDKGDLDEVVRNLLITISQASGALNEIYDSCGPFIRGGDEST